MNLKNKVNWIGMVKLYYNDFELKSLFVGQICIKTNKQCLGSDLKYN